MKISSESSLSRYSEYGVRAAIMSLFPSLPSGLPPRALYAQSTSLANLIASRGRRKVRSSMCLYFVCRPGISCASSNTVSQVQAPSASSATANRRSRRFRSVHLVRGLSHSMTDMKFSVSLFLSSNCSVLYMSSRRQSTTEVRLFACRNELFIDVAASNSPVSI